MSEPLTRDDFGPSRNGVNFYEDEDGDLWAYGHVHPEDMVAAVAAFYAEVSSPSFDLVPPGVEDVQHVYAIRADGPPGSDEGPYMNVTGVNADTPGAVPITYIHA